MRDYSRIRYWIDWAGRIWKGPLNRDDNLHYAAFEGYMIVPPGDPVWVLQRSDEPTDADEITEEQAARAQLRFTRAPQEDAT